CDKQENRGDFERQHVVLENRVADGFRVPCGHAFGGVREIQTASRDPERKEDLRRQHQRENYGDIFLAVELYLAQGDVEIYQHDHEDKQHHDAADVENNLHDEKKFRFELEKDAGRGQQGGNQEDRGVDDVAPRDHQDGGDDGHGGEEVEERLV